MDPIEAAALLDEITEDHARAFEIASEFRKRTPSGDGPGVRYTAAALEYNLLASGDERRETYGPSPR